MSDPLNWTLVLWWRDHGLALRQILARQGRLMPIEFVEPGSEQEAEQFPSAKPDVANAFYEQIRGLRSAQARAKMAELLSDPSGSSGRSNQKIKPGV